LNEVYVSYIFVVVIEFIGMCLWQVVFYKRIGRVFFTDSIPKAASGKILRKVLTARLNEGLVVAN